MTAKDYDILIIGPTGYTGRLIVEYLCTHKVASSLRIALGGRTLAKVHELASKGENFEVVHVDVSKEDTVHAAVAKTHVVMNIAGPYWTHGSTVVRACAMHGVHYLDLTGEANWVSKIIADYDYLAHKNRTCIIPCSGFDSIPSDLAAYLSIQTLEKRLLGSGLPESLNITSTAAVRWKGFGVSGGTAATIISSVEEVPPIERRAGSGWGLSPVPGPAGFSGAPKFLYSLPYVRPTLYGGFFAMSTINEPIVRRSWGLRERHRREQAIKSGVPSPGSTFAYTEFLGTRSRFGGIVLSLIMFTFGAALTLFSPARWLAKRLLPVSGTGPPREKLESGWFEITNVAEAEGVVVKSVFKGQGDPGYYLTARMIVESALMLLDSSNLTPLGRQGGILTPTTAFGDNLAKALEATGQFETSSTILSQEESKKTR